MGSGIMVLSEIGSKLLILVCISRLWVDSLGNEQPNETDWTSYQTCLGENQSPINIPRTGLPEIEFPTLEFVHYSIAPEKMILKNTGSVLELSFMPYRKEFSPKLSGGGLSGSYKLSKVNFHWGHTYGSGSEHTKSVTSFPMEAQLIHFKDSFNDLESASSSNKWDSIAIVAVFYNLQLGAVAISPNMDIVSNALNNITEPDSEIEIQSFAVSTLLPESSEKYYRYNGSMTQPPCRENVVWTVLAKPQILLVEQLVEFSKLKDRNGEALVGNVRPLQTLGSRTILSVGRRGRKINPSESSSTTDQSSTLRFELNFIQLWTLFLAGSLSLNH